MAKAKSVAARRRSRRWLLGGLVFLMVAAVVTVTVQWFWGPRPGSGHPAAPIGTPADLLVSFPLNRQLVPGWRTSAAALGLPPGAGVGNVFATKGSKAYFATDCDPNCADHPTTWVYGLDTRTGARLFATPTPPKGAVLKRATVYNGGFAYQFEEAGKSGVLFYDTSGRLMSRQYADHYPVLVENAAVPIILDAPVFRVYTAAGKLLASIPADTAYSQAPLFGVIGTKLYAWLGYSRGEHWQQWDLLTGERGITCGFHLSGLVGSDGHVVLAEDEAGMYVATDMSTCQTLWKTPTRDGLMRRINTGLIRTTHDTVSSLQPPS